MKVEIGKLKLGKFTPRLPGRNYAREHLAEITVSLKEFSQWSPILINRDFYVIEGETRVEAAERLGWRVIEAKILDVPDKTARLIALNANISQRNLDPMEEAFAIKSLHDEGLSIRQIAKKIGKSKTWVADRLRLATNVHPEIQASLRDRKSRITPVHARHLAKLNPKDQLVIAREIVEKKLTDEQTAQKVQVALIHRQVVPASSEPERPMASDAQPKPQVSNVISVTEVGPRIRDSLLDVTRLHLFKDFDYSASGTCSECGKRTTLRKPRLTVNAWKKHIVEALKRDLDELTSSQETSA